FDQSGAFDSAKVVVHDIAGNRPTVDPDTRGISTEVSEDRVARDERACVADDAVAVVVVNEVSTVGNQGWAANNRCSSDDRVGHDDAFPVVEDLAGFDGRITGVQ